MSSSTQSQAKMQSAACLIGAGYSAVAGLPLAADLLTTRVAIVSKRAERSYKEVWSDYEKWQSENPRGYPEQYLSELYARKRWWSAPHFSQAVELIAAVLATPYGLSHSVSPRYAIRITQPSRCKAHVAFWSTIAALFEEIAAITTNYDLLIERALRYRPMKLGFGLGCYYGGLSRPQFLKGTALPFSVLNPQRNIELRGKIPVYKLHGSLNWSKTNEGLALFQDMRPAFRHGGDAAIVPPIREKEVPNWLKPVWCEARKALAASQCWLVCGYSLPEYDAAIRSMLQEAVRPELKAILILDPHSESLERRYSRIAPNVRIYCLAGLPEGIQQLQEVLS